MPTFSFERLDVNAIDLGVGNRSIVSGGRLDPKYQITVPANYLRSSESSLDICHSPK
jgi:Transcriptional regulator, AbiEi antitoxin, Type IV TA system